MKGNLDQDRKTWHRIEELFKFRETFKRNIAEENSTLETFKIDEVESIIYEELSPQIESIILIVKRCAIPRESIKELVNEAIHKMFNAYSGFRGESSLRTYFTRIAENVLIDHLRKADRERDMLVYDEETIAVASDKMALAQFNENKKPNAPKDMIPNSAGSILETIDLKEVGLTDKEFVAVVLKLSSRCLMKQKLADEELARTLGIKRATFVDAYLRGRDKICRYLKEKQKIEKSDRT